MPLATDTALQVRLRIRDQYRFEEELLYGDGTASSFKLKQGRPFSVISGTANTGISAYRMNAGGAAITGATGQQELGRVIFSNALSANSAVLVNYQWTIFSDEEISYFTAIGGTVAGAALQAIRVLEADAARLARWGSPDGSTYDPTQTFANLAAIKAQLLDEIRGADEGPAGSVESWAENQELYF